MHVLEREDKLSRALEFLPADSEMDERFTRGLGLTRPELCVLMAYAKLTIYDHLLNSDLPDDSVLEKLLLSYFPKALQENRKREILEHPLRREIIGTQIANNLINRLGVNFITKMRGESSAPVIAILKAYLIVAEAYQTEELFLRLEQKAMPADDRLTVMRRIVAEIENMTLTVLRDGMESDIAAESKRWVGYKDDKFKQLRAELA